MGRQVSQGCVFSFSLLRYSKCHSHIICFSFPSAQCQAIRKPQGIQHHSAVHKGTLAQLCRAVWHREHFAERRVIPRMLPAFICYTPRAAVIASEREAGQRLLFLTLLPQSPPWVQQELSGKATDVQGGYCQQPTTRRQAGGSRRIRLRAMFSEDRWSKITSERVHKWDSWVFTQLQ